MWELKRNGQDLLNSNFACYHPKESVRQFTKRFKFSGIAGVFVSFFFQFHVSFFNFPISSQRLSSQTYSEITPLIFSRYFVHLHFSNVTNSKRLLLVKKKCVAKKRARICCKTCISRQKILQSLRSSIINDAPKNFALKPAKNWDSTISFVPLWNLKIDFGLGFHRFVTLQIFSDLRSHRVEIS